MFFFFWPTSLCIIGSRFIHLIRTDSNAFLFITNIPLGFPGGSNGKESACNVGVLGSTPGSERNGEGNIYPFQHSCLQNSMDRGAWWATVRGVTVSQSWLHNKHFHFTLNNPLFICTKTSLSIHLSMDSLLPCPSYCK